MSKKLLLHACCAPCSLEPVRLLQDEGFDITICWTNPNIQPASEHEKRENELLMWAEKQRIPVIYAQEDYAAWERIVAPYKMQRDARCRACYALRLQQAAAIAAEHHFEYLSTTLAVSPYQLFDACTEILEAQAKKYHVKPVVRDWRSHYACATQRARDLGMYRQKYCGCRFSALEAAHERHERRDERKQQKALQTDAK